MAEIDLGRVEREPAEGEPAPMVGLEVGPSGTPFQDHPGAAARAAVRRDGAAIRLDSGAQRHERSGVVGGRIGVRDRAADRAAVAHLRVADVLGEAR